MTIIWDKDVDVGDGAKWHFSLYRGTIRVTSLGQADHDGVAQWKVDSGVCQKCKIIMCSTASPVHCEHSPTFDITNAALPWIKVDNSAKPCSDFEVEIGKGYIVNWKASGVTAVNIFIASYYVPTKAISVKISLAGQQNI